MRVLLSGNEAIARGAFEYGVKVVTGYPGTPSTEIVESASRFREIYSEWSANEKVALDVAIGAAYTGRRAMAVMKMSGLNVAADSLFYVPYTGLNGGALLIVVADDPGQFSSQTEQDSRHYAHFAKLPVIEPSDSQEAKDFVGIGLDLSQEWDTPVMLRTVMRISHCASIVELGERRYDDAAPPPPFHHDLNTLICTSPRSRARHPVVEKRLDALARAASSFPINRLEWRGRRLGIVSSGPVYCYAREVFPNASFLRLGMTYPLPIDLVREFAAGVEQLLVVEELDPFLEEQIKILGIPCRGKDIFPCWGELTPGVIEQSAAVADLLPQDAVKGRRNVVPADLPIRSPTFCPGCPHRSTFYALSKIKGLVIAGDIGCYNMASLPPFDLIDTAGAMGASVGVAHGFGVAGLQERIVAVIGDSTLFHTGIPPIINMIHNGGCGTVIILDNHTTAMTGHQDHPGVDIRLGGEPASRIDIEQMVRGWGLANVRKVNAFAVKEVEQAIKEALASSGLSVVIVDGPCVFVGPHTDTIYEVDSGLCVACRQCLHFGCPAIVHSQEVYTKTGRHKSCIEAALCVGCAMCAQVCPPEAIRPRETER